MVWGVKRGIYVHCEGQVMSKDGGLLNKPWAIYSESEHFSPVTGINTGSLHQLLVKHHEPKRSPATFSSSTQDRVYFLIVKQTNHHSVLQHFLLYVYHSRFISSSNLPAWRQETFWWLKMSQQADSVTRRLNWNTFLTFTCSTRFSLCVLRGTFLFILNCVNFSWDTDRSCLSFVGFLNLLLWFYSDVLTLIHCQLC